MKKVGFIDYYISEWHANNYPAWFAEVNQAMGLDYCVAYAWAEKDVSPMDGVTTDQWCENFGVTRCSTIAELCEKSDVIAILAPSNPEKHLGYAKEALTLGKPTYIDKTFAPSLAVAEEIFAIAKKYNTPFFTSSALRYADEFEEFSDIKNLVITAPGGNFPEYIIHPAEMAVTLLKEPFVKAKAEVQGKQVICRAVTQSGRGLSIIFAQGIGYTATSEKNDGGCVSKNVVSPIFPNLVTAMLGFFETGKQPFDPDETLEVMRLRDALMKGTAQDGEWIEV